MERELPEDVANSVGNRRVEDIAIEVIYKNYKGETGLRKIIPLGMYYGHNEYHKEDQWLLKVWDLDKWAYRDYALKDIIEWKKI